MDIFILALLGLIIFIIHEIEEIVRFVPWIKRYEHNPEYVDDMLVKRKWAYPSTPTVLLIIAEEVALLLAILCFGALAKNYELILATIVINTVHLIGHIGVGAYSRHPTPGIYTAIPMSLVSFWLVWFVWLNHPIHLTELVMYSFVIGLILLINLWCLQKNARRIESWRKGIGIK